MKQTLGTQLRHLIDLLDGAVEASYVDAGLEFRPRYTPIVRALLEQEPSTIGSIAQRAGLTQPAVTQTVGLMVKADLVAVEAGSLDARQRLIRLTDRGRAMVPNIQACWRATLQATAELEAELSHSLSDALAQAIAALERKPFDGRIAAVRARLADAPNATIKPRRRRAG